MDKKKNFGQLAIFGILALTILIWGIDHYIYSFLPPYLDNPYLLILAILGFIVSFNNASKAFVEIIKNFKRSEEKSKEEKLMEALRSSTNDGSVGLIQKYVYDILGKTKADDLWDQIHQHGRHSEVLIDLIANPFMAAGLIEVYQNENGSLPKNIGALLDKLIQVQWTKETLGQKDWISFKDMQIAFGALAKKHYPQRHFPTRHEGQRTDPYEDFLQYLGQIRKPYWQIRLAYAVLLRIFKDEDAIDQKLEGTPRIIIWIASLLFFIVMMPLRSLIAIIRFLFFILEMGVSQLSNKLRLYNLHRGYGRLQRLVQKFDFSRKRNKKRALRMIAKAEKAQFFVHADRKGYFTKHYWATYFAAVGVIEERIDIRAYARWNQFWMRLDPRKDAVAEYMCGMVEDPNTFITKLITIDPIVAAKCILSGLEEVSYDIRSQTYDQLLKNVLDFHAGGEWEKRSLDSAKYLLHLRNDPSVIDDLLKVIREVPGDFLQIDGGAMHVKLEMVQLIAEYGVNTVEILIDRFHKAVDEEEKKYILYALGEINDKRALPLLESMKNDPDIYIRVYVLATLAIDYSDHQAYKVLRNCLLTDPEDKTKQRAWYALINYRKDSILLAIRILALANKACCGIDENGETFYGHEWRFAKEMFVKTIGYHTKQTKEIDKALLSALTDTRNKNKELIGALIKTLGKRRNHQAVDICIAHLNSQIPTDASGQLDDEDKELRFTIISALGSIGSPNAIQKLIEILFSASDISAKRATVDALGKMESEEVIPPLSRKLREEEKDKALLEAEEIDFLSLDIIRIFIKIGSPEALNVATQWCGAHLSDTRRTVWSEKTVSQEARHLLTYYIDTTEARELLKLEREEQN